MKKVRKCGLRIGFQVVDQECGETSCWRGVGRADAGSAGAADSDVAVRLGSGKNKDVTFRQHN